MKEQTHKLNYKEKINFCKKKKKNNRQLIYKIVLKSYLIKNFKIEKVKITNE